MTLAAIWYATLEIQITFVTPVTLLIAVTSRHAGSLGRMTFLIRTAFPVSGATRHASVGLGIAGHSVLAGIPSAAFPHATLGFGVAFVPPRALYIASAFDHAGLCGRVTCARTPERVAFACVRFATGLTHVAHRVAFVATRTLIMLTGLKATAAGQIAGVTPGTIIIPVTLRHASAFIRVTFEAPGTAAVGIASRFASLG